MEKILIIEDDELIAGLERDYLETSGFEVEITANGKEGCRFLLEKKYAGAIIDIMLPGKDGFAICREVRRQRDIPILLVSAKKEEVDKIRGFKLGADDYLVKPFSPAELVARLQAHIEMHKRLLNEEQGAEHVISFQNLKILEKERRVYLDKEEIVLVNKEYELLLFLAKNPNIAFSREILFDRVWGMDAAGSTSTVTVHINRLREKIDKGRKKPFIDTVWGVGYRFHG